MDEEQRRNLINTYSQSLMDVNGQITLLLNNQRLLITQLNHLINCVRIQRQQPNRNREHSRHYYNFSEFPRLSGANRSFYDRVPIVPSAAQIRSACRSCLFSDIDNPINSECPISLDRFSPESEVFQITHCGHVFGRESLRSWFQSNAHCPVCRYDIREYEEPETNDSSSNPLPNQTSPAQQPSTTRTHLSNSSLASLTETLLRQLIPPSASYILDPSQNNVYYDSAGDQIFFEGFFRR
jgi:hypothetical protein